MAFYLRKSLKVGPMRFNLSKSGIGVSTGFKGFRIGANPFEVRISPRVTTLRCKQRDRLVEE